MAKSKRGAVLDGLISKIDKELNESTTEDPTIAGSNSGASKPLVSPNGTPTMPPTDPFKIKTKVREARRAEILRRHKGVQSVKEFDDEVADGEDLKSNLDFVDENKHSTMEWNEPDGSKSTLKFDENGTLVGKEKPKTIRRT